MELCATRGAWAGRHAGMLCISHGHPWPRDPHPDPPHGVFPPHGLGAVFCRGSASPCWMVSVGPQPWNGVCCGMVSVSSQLWDGLCPPQAWCLLPAAGGWQGSTVRAAPCHGSLALLSSVSHGLILPCSPPCSIPLHHTLALSQAIYPSCGCSVPGQVLAPVG